MTRYYDYEPSHIAPAVFAALVGISLLVHVYQVLRYKFWRVTFFMCWGGLVFTTGWVMRTIASYNTSSLDMYIAQTCLILGGPPIYAAAEYNILGRLMHYVPMHAPLHPGRVVIFFVYVGAAVESLTAAGAALLSGGADDPDVYRRGGTLISISLVLQAVVELFYVSLVALMHHRCNRSGMTSRNLRSLFLMLYGTSSLVLLRCIARAIEAFAVDLVSSPDQCNSFCNFFVRNEWYLFAFEGAPMVIYTYWLNIIHPGRLLPRNKMRYLDTDGRTERIGPGWIDKRSRWETFADPWDLVNTIRGDPQHEKYWLKPDQWPSAQGGSFALGTASNSGAAGLKVNTRSAKKDRHAETKYSPVDGQGV